MEEDAPRANDLPNASSRRDSSDTRHSCSRQRGKASAGDATDATQHIIFVNEAFERRNGYRRHEVMGRSLRLLRGPDTEEAVLAKISEQNFRNDKEIFALVNAQVDRIKVTDGIGKLVGFYDWCRRFV